jgi:hypothetical protein
VCQVDQEALEALEVLEVLVDHLKSVVDYTLVVHD